MTEPSHAMTRRRLLTAGGAAAGAAVLVAAGFEAGFGRAAARPLALPGTPADPDFITRPDLRIPGLTVTKNASGVSGGLIFIAPYNAPAHALAGAVVTDNNGDILWEQPIPHTETMNLRVQTYQGRPALTWWQGYITLGHGVGHYVIADHDYRPLANVNAGNGLQGDLHEFLLTDRGTALLTSYVVTERDLRAVGGSAKGTIQDAIFQEIDIKSGRVLLEWHSLDHIPITDSYWPLSHDWDYVHLNSIDVTHDGNLLVSSRNTHTIYKIERHTGQVMWRMGGKRSDFQIAHDAAYAWQHDARRRADNMITVFDNGNKISRAMVLNFDERSRRVTLQRAYFHPAKLFADSQGSVQILPNGNLFVGWGAQPYVSEFTPGGEVVFDGKLGKGYISYRAYRLPWVGFGDGAPTVATRRANGANAAYVSWNGDTRVARWRLLGGSSRSQIQPVSSIPRSGFETAIPVPRGISYVRLQGLDASGATLATTPVVAV